MSHHSLPQSFYGWDEEATTDQMNVPFSSAVNFQPNQQATFETPDNTFVGQNHASQEICPSFETHTEPYHQYSDGNLNPALAQSLSSTAGPVVPPHFETTDYLDHGNNAGSLGMGSNYPATQNLHSGTRHDHINQQTLQCGETFQAHSSFHHIDGQLCDEQRQLGIYSAPLLGIGDLPQSSLPQSEFFPSYDALIEGTILSPSTGVISLLGIDPTLLSCNSFDVTAPATSGLNETFNVDYDFSNQHIWGHNYSQWGQNCTLGDELPTSNVTTGNHEIVNVEGHKPMEAIEIPDNDTAITNTGNQLASSSVNKKRGVATAFGPSRAISLPPARKGGRRGPLPVASLKKRRETMKQGVCIRCRQTKEKVALA
ncbi:MAG: hypothetical protein M1818_001315 [Claussenomyces sp. TS43310]|nr:MAG: hypothetical protein M1818_001315 [Claussenomyces sp. TS43310]